MNANNEIDLVRTVAFAVTDPKLLTLDITKIEKTAKAVRAQRDKDNPGKVDSPKVAFSKLRNQLFDLKQNAKSCEIRLNNEVGNMTQLESRLKATLKTLKEHETSGNLLGARHYEHAAQRLENELADARQRVVREQSNNSNAARALRVWNTENSARLEELQKEVG